MSAPAVTIYSTGMVCGVGLNALTACAAIRAGINNFQETRFMDNGGEWIMGCAAPLEKNRCGRSKLVEMAVMAIRECLAHPESQLAAEETPLLVCVAEAERPGRLSGLDDELLQEIQTNLGMRFHGHSAVIAQGRVGGAVALYQARKLLHEYACKRVLIVGVDSLLVGSSLSVYQQRDRLLTSKNSNGFLPGEAAASLLVGAPVAEEWPRLHCIGMGFAIEKATVDSELPLRADALTAAIKAAEADAGRSIGTTDFRITDLSGEQYYFKEAALALSRTLRDRKEFYDIWHPADCFGEVGAAIGPAILVILQNALIKNWAPGSRILCHVAGDNGKRAAQMFTYQSVARR